MPLRGASRSISNPLLGAVASLVLATAALGCGSDAATLVPSAPVQPTPTAAEGAAPNIPPVVPANVAIHLQPWNATPIPVDPVLRVAIDVACRAGLANGGFDGQVVLVLIDARAGSAVQVHYAGRTDQATCSDVRINLDGSIAAPGGTGWTSDDHPIDQPRVNELRIEDGGSSDDPATSSFVFGVAGPNIVRVLIQQPTRPPVLATMQNGWFGAWIPMEWEVGWRIAGFDALDKKVAVLEGF